MDDAEPTSTDTAIDTSSEPERQRRTFRAVRGGTRAGRRLDPEDPVWHVLDRKNGHRHLPGEAGRPLAVAWRQARALLEHRDLDDPWRERLIVAPVPPGERPGRQHVAGERPDPGLVRWELVSRLERLGWSQSRLADAAQVQRSTVHLAVTGRAIRPDTLAALREALRRAEENRGLRQRRALSVVDEDDEDEDDEPTPKAKRPQRGTTSGPPAKEAATGRPPPAASAPSRTRTSGTRTAASRTR